jgi:hypothetical protein
MDRAALKKTLGFGYDEKRVFGFADAGYNADKLNANIEKLTAISNDMMDVKDILREDEIRKLLEWLHRLWKRGVSLQEVELSFLEAKSIGYGLTKETELDFLLYLHGVEEQEPNWTPSCLKGFLHSTLAHWFDFQPGVCEANAAFIRKHVEKEAGELLSVIPFIEEDGPYKLGLIIRKRGQSYMMAPQEVLMPTTRINYPYFGDTLLAFFNNYSKREYDDLKAALDLHNQARTDKVLIPKLILAAKSYDKKLLELATKRIGDPFDEFKWAAIASLTTEQRNTLTLARKRLLGWVMQEVVRVFFEVFCHDKERKDFWTKHAHQVSNFYIFGSYGSRNIALGRLPYQSVQRHFRTVESTVDNCALAMYIGDYAIVEFTQVGALYAYKVSGQNYKRAFSRINNLEKIDDLKIPSIPMLYDLDYSRFAKEGKMNHQGYWVSRMDRWIDHQVKLNMDEESSK